MMKRKNLLFVFLFGATILCGCVQKAASTPSTSTPSLEKYSLNDALNEAKKSNLTIYGDIYTVFDEYGGEIKTNFIEMAFADGIISTQLCYYYDEELTEEPKSIYFEKSDGKTYYRTITLDNKVEDIEYTVNGQSVVFEDNFFNPFSLLKFSDFIEGSNRNEYILKPSIAQEFALSVLHLSVLPQTVYLQINQNRFESITIKTQMGLGGLGLSSSERYDLTIEYGTDLKIPELVPYEHQNQHDLLFSALSELNQKLAQRNYTANVLMTNIDETETYSSSNYYVTTNAIYHDSTDENGMSYGVVQQGDGLHEFVTYMNEDERIIEVMTSIISHDRSSVEPNFLGFAEEIFDIDGNNYYAKTNYLAKLITLLFPYTIRDYLAYYSFEFIIELSEDNTFKQMSVSYFDTAYMQSGKVIISYNQIGTTKLPFVI